MPVQAINEGWDLRRTLKQNYASMGLATDPNAALPIKKTDVQRKLEQADKEVTLKSMAVMKGHNDDAHKGTGAGARLLLLHSSAHSFAHSLTLCVAMFCCCCRAGCRGQSAHAGALPSARQSTRHEWGLPKADARTRFGRAIAHSRMPIVASPVRLHLLLQSMSIAEQKRIALLLQKHGDDYAAMFRDRQVNTMQETEAVLKKRVALYKRLQSL